MPEALDPQTILDVQAQFKTLADEQRSRTVAGLVANGADPEKAARMADGIAAFAAGKADIVTGRPLAPGEFVILQRLPSLLGPLTTRSDDA